MAKNSGWYNNIARLVKKKNGKFCLIFERSKNKAGEHMGESPYPLVINEGDILQARLKREDLEGLVVSGKMSQEIADRICETVKFEISKAPDADDNLSKSVSVKKSPAKGGVDF